MKCKKPIDLEIQILGHALIKIAQVKAIYIYIVIDNIHRLQISTCRHCHEPSEHKKKLIRGRVSNCL